VSHNEVSQTGKGSRNIWEWKKSVSKRNRGKGLRDTSFGKKFEGVMWTEGDGHGMSAENLDEVGGMFSVVNFVYI